MKPTRNWNSTFGLPNQVSPCSVPKESTSSFGASKGLGEPIDWFFCRNSGRVRRCFFRVVTVVTSGIAFPHTVDGSKIWPSPLEVGSFFPLFIFIYRVLAPSQVVGVPWDFWIINSIVFISWIYPKNPGCNHHHQDDMENLNRNLHKPSLLLGGGVRFNIYTP